MVAHNAIAQPKKRYTYNTIKSETGATLSSSHISHPYLYLKA